MRQILSGGRTRCQQDEHHLEGLLGWSSEERNAVALDLYGSGGQQQLAELTCGAISVMVDGSILAPVL
jgi:hypothetical protein